MVIGSSGKKDNLKNALLTLIHLAVWLSYATFGPVLGPQMCAKSEPHACYRRLTTGSYKLLFSNGLYQYEPLELVNIWTKGG